MQTQRQEERLPKVGVNSRPQLALTNFTRLSREALLEILHHRNDPQIRRCMINTSPITTEEHLRFCASLKDDPKRLYLEARFEESFIGALDFQSIDRKLHTYEPGSYFLPTVPRYLCQDTCFAAALVALKLRLWYQHIRVKKDNEQALIFNTLLMGARIKTEDECFWYLENDALSPQRQAPLRSFQAIRSALAERCTLSIRL